MAPMDRYRALPQLEALWVVKTYLKEFPLRIVKIPVDPALVKPLDILGQKKSPQQIDSHLLPEEHKVEDPDDAHQPGGEERNEG